MTIRLPKPDVFDRILRFFGKKRSVQLPPNVDKEFGSYSIIVAKKVSFIKALLSPWKIRLPKGCVYLENFKVNTGSEYGIVSQKK